MNSLHQSNSMVPVLIPNSLLSLDIPLGVMEESIKNFNIQMKIEGLKLSTDELIVGECMELVQEDMNLYLKLFVIPHSIRKLENLRAKLMGYVVMEKKTGKVEQLVIEGFNVVNYSPTDKKELDFFCQV